MLQKSISIAPLVVYRILFGLMLFYGGISSILKNDIAERYTEPTFFFKYYGLEWLGYVGDQGIYILYGIWLVASVGVILGGFYRLSIVALVASFSYLHLLDATNYINHYYAISILGCFLMVLPAHAAYSLDVWRKPSLARATIPQWQISIFQLQIAIIYLGAAIAKMNADWILAAMPLKIWLLQATDFPLIGSLFQYQSVHYIASWAGLFFDLTIVGWLLYAPTRKYAYAAVLLFHTLTGMLLNIGLFPLLMISTTTLFFAPEAHQIFLQKCFGNLPTPTSKPTAAFSWLMPIAVLHFAVQLLLPFRHIAYPCNPIWTEEGYRFSWWVMLAEKDGIATFYVQDSQSNRRWEIENSDYLTPFQEKRMTIRPDHILQFGQHLATTFEQQQHLVNPIVTADVFVTLNGRSSRRLIDGNINLATQKRQLGHYDWILCYD